MVAPLVLHNTHVSTCSQKVRMCLHEKSLEWEDRQVNLMKFEQLAPEYLALNPNGVVPTLVDNGIPIVDSSVIIEYLEDKYPAPALAPSDPAGRAEVRAWMRYFEEVPTQAIRVPTFNALLVPRLRDMGSSELDNLTGKMPVRKQFYRKMVVAAGGFDERDTADSLERLRATIERISKALEGNRWLCGDLFTLADITLMPTIVRMHDLGLSELWHGHPAVARWFTDIQERASFGKTFYPGSRVNLN